MTAEQVYRILETERLPPNAEQKADTAADDSDKSLSPASGNAWLVRSVLADLATSGTAGSRQLVVEVQDGSGNAVVSIPAGITQGASSTVTYLYGPNLPDLTAQRNGLLMTPFPDGLVVPDGFSLRVADDAAVDPAADDLTVRAVVNVFTRPVTSSKP